MSSSDEKLIRELRDANAQLKRLIRVLEAMNRNFVTWTNRLADQAERHRSQD